MTKAELADALNFGLGLLYNDDGSRNTEVSDSDIIEAVIEQLKNKLDD